MTEFYVQADIGTLDTTVTADTADEAVSAAIEQWSGDTLAAAQIFAGGTFTVSRAGNQSLHPSDIRGAA
jgi:hypothetical protein